MKSTWLKPIRVQEAAKVDLICFPFAGSGASIFYPWEKILDSRINVYAFQAPGREDRIGEDLIQDLNNLTKQASAEIFKTIGSRPFALFGHSLGAVIAFEVTKILEKLSKNPQLLFVSGRQPPHLSLKMPPISGLSDSELLKGLLNLNGTDPEILAHPDLLEIILPIIRSDFKMGENYLLPINDEKVQCPIVTIGTIDDPWLDLNEIAEWKYFTLKQCHVEILSGDHFYVKNNFIEVIQLLNKMLLER